MKQGLSKAQIVELASRREFFVSRYSHGHRTLRKKCKQLEAEGILRLCFQAGSDLVFRTVKGKTAADIPTTSL